MTDLDGPYTGGILQRVLGLIDIPVRGRHIDKHERLGVSSERVRHEHRELGVAVGDVLLLGCEGADDIAEG